MEEIEAGDPSPLAEPMAANYSSWRRERHFDPLLHIELVEVSRGVTCHSSLAKEHLFSLLAWNFSAVRDPTLDSKGKIGAFKWKLTYLFLA